MQTPALDGAHGQGVPALHLCLAWDSVDGSWHPVQLIEGLLILSRNNLNFVVFVLALFWCCVVVLFRMVGWRSPPGLLKLGFSFVS